MCHAENELAGPRAPLLVCQAHLGNEKTCRLVGKGDGPPTGSDERHRKLRAAVVDQRQAERAPDYVGTETVLGHGKSCGSEIAEILLFLGRFRMTLISLGDEEGRLGPVHGSSLQCVPALSRRLFRLRLGRPSSEVHRARTRLGGWGMTRRARTLPYRRHWQARRRR
jgi:hypothetical protein